jgi:carbon storage regulator
MLVMWRHAGQILTIDENIEIEVLESRHNKVKLGITAPRSVTVSRKEEQITRSENITAAWSVDSAMIEQLVHNLSKGPSIV